MGVCTRVVDAQRNDAPPSGTLPAELGSCDGCSMLYTTADFGCTLFGAKPLEVLSLQEMRERYGQNPAPVAGIND